MWFLFKYRRSYWFDKEAEIYIYIHTESNKNLIILYLFQENNMGEWFLHYIIKYDSMHDWMEIIDR